jgi:glycosyltransferase involved in cell wall biosynthesis
MSIAEAKDDYRSAPVDGAPRSATIAICTHNRAGLLAETLDNVLPQVLAGSDPAVKAVDVLVVDNNSTDDTAAVVEARRERYPSLRYVFEPIPGLSPARNRAMKEALHDVVIFLDDDVEVAADWLRETLAAFTANNVAVAGGRVLPCRLDLPDWLPPDLKGIVSVLDPPNDEMVGCDLIGANIAVRLSVLGEQAFFDTRLGRKGRRLIGGEESDLLYRTRKAGLGVKFQRSSVVYHKIEDKLNQEYVTRFIYWHGVCDSVRDRTHRQWLRVLLKAGRSCATLCGLYYLKLLRSHEPADWVREQLRWRYALGYLCSPLVM